MIDDGSFPYRRIGWNKGVAFFGDHHAVLSLKLDAVAGTESSPENLRNGRVGQAAQHLGQDGLCVASIRPGRRVGCVDEHPHSTHGFACSMYRRRLC
jgi:hypothetical protein